MFTTVVEICEEFLLSKYTLIPPLSKALPVFPDCLPPTPDPSGQKAFR